MNTPATPRLSLNQVAKATGRSKGTISKALNNGTLSYLNKSENGQYEIDMAEALRVFPPKTPQDRIEQEQFRTSNTEELNHSLVQQMELDRLKHDLERAESERHRERQSSQAQIEDLIKQRDEWKEQSQETLKLRHERDSEHQANVDKAEREHRSELDKRVKAEKEIEQLRERLKNEQARAEAAERSRAEALRRQQQPVKKRWSFF